MSYSFSIKAPNKADAKAAVDGAFRAVVDSQPIHARDRDAALAAAGAMIDLLVDAPGMQISVSVNGYVSWRDGRTEADLIGAAVSVSASLVALDKPA